MVKNRVLYISYDGMTDPLGQSQVIPYLAKLRHLNYEITILSTEKEENLSKHKALIKRICEENNIKWEYIIYTKKPPILSTIRDVRALKKKTLSLHLENKFTIIHCRSYIASLIGKSLKSK